MSKEHLDINFKIEIDEYVKMRVVYKSIDLLYDSLGSSERHLSMCMLNYDKQHIIKQFQRFIYEVFKYTDLEKKFESKDEMKKFIDDNVLSAEEGISAFADDLLSYNRDEAFCKAGIYDLVDKD